MTAEKKAFQAFNIKPLRQKLPTPSDLDQLRKKGAEPETQARLSIRGNRLYANSPELERSHPDCAGLW